MFYCLSKRRQLPRVFHKTTSRNASDPTASSRYVDGQGRCEYQRARITTAIAPTKNRTKPTAAATPIGGKPIPTNKPSAPAPLSAPSVNNHECEPSHLAMLSSTH